LLTWEHLFLSLYRIYTKELFIQCVPKKGYPLNSSEACSNLNALNSLMSKSFSIVYVINDVHAFILCYFSWTHSIHL
jgi:hypothetical protein